MRAHETVMMWVQDQLQSGALRIGDRLPGERQLAGQLGVSRAGVREALRILEAMGSVTSATGSGPRAGTIIISSPHTAHALAFNLQLATQHVDFSDVVETRLLLETWAAAHAQADFAYDAAHSLLASMDDPALSRADFLALDARFHAELAKSGGNPLISTLMDAIRTAIAEQTAQRAEQVTDWDATKARLQREHHAILAAHSSGEHDHAAQLISEHIMGYYHSTQGADLTNVTSET